MKNAYKYLYYKFYKLSEFAPARWLSEWKASLVMDVLAILVISSLMNYYKLIDRTSHLGEGKSLLMFSILICVVNYFIFNMTDRWKEIVVEFDSISTTDRRKNNILFWTILIMVFGNFFLSFYLYYHS